MAALTTQLLVDAGTAPTFSVANASETAEVGTGVNTFYVIKNGDGTNAKTVTITAPGSTPYGQPLPDPAITVASNGERWIPLRKEYIDSAVAGAGRCTIAVTGTGGLGSVTAAVVRVG